MGKSKDIKFKELLFNLRKIGTHLWLTSCGGNKNPEKVKTTVALFFI